MERIGGCMYEVYGEVVKRQLRSCIYGWSLCVVVWHGDGFLIVKKAKK